MIRPFAAFPITARLTVAFAVAMTVVLSVTSLWVYERQRDGFRRAIDGRLQDRFEDLRGAVNDRVGSERDDVRVLVGAEPGIVQVYGGDGAVLGGSASLGSKRVISASTARAATSRTRWSDLEAGIGRAAGARALYGTIGDDHMVVAVAESTDASHEALERLATQLLLGALVSVALGSLLAFSLARAALRPVELLRSEAQRRGRGEADVALSVPPARDEVSRLATTLNELLGRMHDAVLHERRFVAEAGHELRTPLATMLAEIDLALESPQAPEAPATLRSVRGETVRLAELSDQLLQLATVLERSEWDSVDLAELVAGRVERVGGAFPDAHIRLADPEPVSMRIDRRAVERAVDNLIDNAIVHGGSTVDLRIAVTASDVTIHVLDDGPGIDADVAHRAFERFARSADARARRGSGLGLAIVESIAQLHGGSAGIGARADGAPGTDAWLSLVRADD